MTIRGNLLSAREPLAVVLVLVIAPALPWFHFWPFWFTLGLAAVAVSLYDLLPETG